MKYDIIIAGAGLAGLSFAHHLIQANTQKSVLILDSDDKSKNDRTWSFWSTDAPNYDCAERYWNNLGFASENFLRFDELGPYSYYTIHGIDFYQEVLAEIRDNQYFTFKLEKIKEVTDSGTSVRVQTTGNDYEASLVIESIPLKGIDSIKEYNVCWQSFLGWTLELADQASVEVDPLIMDFRTVQDDDAANFLYILPYSRSKILVEYTSFSSSKEIDTEKYRNRLADHIKKYITTSGYKILEEEIGQIPMTNYPFERNPSTNIVRLGTVGGDTKPTTGYTFQRVQECCKVLVDNILNNRSLVEDLPETPFRFKFYDELLLRVIRDEPRMVKPIMEFLFKNNPMDRVLRFLDEDTHLIEESLIFGMLPWKPFLKAIVRK